jgi:predicted CopG family antitoxin
MKTIMVSDETYGKLASIKGKKSFTELLSELVDRLKQTNKQELMKFAGILNKAEADDLRKTVAKVREDFEARL